MDELEGYLQCFDEKYRNGVKERISVPYYKDKKLAIIVEAWYFQNPRIVNMLFDLGIHKNPGFGDKHIGEYPLDEITRIAFDRGCTLFNISFFEQPALQRFLDCRERARNAAIAVLGCFSHGRSAAVGEKDVGRIIGRAIWASRGIKEWII
jgi:hypothetical protein